MCRPGRCDRAQERRKVAVPAPEGELDSRAELVALCRRLIAASVEDPTNTQVAKALLDTLRAIPAPPGELDPVEARQARVDAKLALDAAAGANVSPIRRGDGPWHD